MAGESGDPVRPRVEETDRWILIEFAPGNAIQLGKLDGFIAGIQAVECNGVPLFELPAGEVLPTPVIEWVPTARPFQPVDDWNGYLESRRLHGGRWPSRGEWRSQILELGAAEYLDTVIRGRSVVVRFRTGIGEIRWVFENRNDRIAGTSYRGIGWRLEVENAPTVVWAYVREPLPLADDHLYLAQTWGRGFIEERLHPQTRFELPETQQNAFQQPFLFIAGDEATLFEWFDRPTAARENIERDGQFLVRTVAIPFSTGRVRATPMTYWQVARQPLGDRWEKLDAWTAAYEHLAARYRRLLRLGRSEPLPCTLAVTPEADYIHFLERGRAPNNPWLRRLAREELPRLHSQGVRVVYIAAPWESDAEHSREERKPPTWMDERPVMEEIGSQHAPWDLRISPAIGGEPALKELVQAAHRRDMQIILWNGPAHLSLSAPRLVEHPHWPIWRQNGTPDDQDYSDLVGISLAREDFFAFSLNRYRQVLRSTGIDGLFFDSYLTFGVSVDFAQPQPHPQLAELLRLEQALWQMGMNHLHLEGVGVLSVGVGGFGYEATDYLGRPYPEELERFHAIRGREYGLYRFVADTFLEARSYYRALASKGMICIFNLRQLDRLSEREQAFVRRANHEYLQVLGKMQHRRLIGDGDRWQGVAWTRDAAAEIVLFAFDKFTFRFSGVAGIEDLTAGRKFAADGSLSTKRWHTYVISPREDGR